MPARSAPPPRGSLVHRGVATEFTEGSSSGSGASDRTGTGGPDVGPVVSAEQRDRVMGYLDGARARWSSRPRRRGRRPACPAATSSRPTVFPVSTPAMTIAREEVFGPVVTITEIASDEEASHRQRRPNRPRRRHLFPRCRRALAMARRIETGSVWINGWYLGGVQAPTGGTKESGIGRERGLVGVAISADQECRGALAGPRVLLLIAPSAAVRGPATLPRAAGEEPRREGADRPLARVQGAGRGGQLAGWTIFRLTAPAPPSGPRRGLVMRIHKLN